MNRKQVVQRQILAGVIIVVIAVIVLAVHGYLASFIYQVPVGKLTEATLGGSDGTLPTWKDPARLAALRAALPRYEWGPGFIPYEHSHAAYSLAVRDDRGRQIVFQLPVGYDALVGVGSPTLATPNSWQMPRLLARLAQYGLADMAAQKINAPGLQGQLEYWRSTFGPQGGQGG
jgi:hypothetical protein